MFWHKIIAKGFAKKKREKILLIFLEIVENRKSLGYY
jgi:hypothetical protein